MYLLRFHGRDELEQMKISKDKRKLEAQALKEIDGPLQIRRGVNPDLVFIYCKEREIGVIGKIEEI